MQLVPAQDSDAERLADLRVTAMRPSLEAIDRFDPTRARARFLDSFVASDTQLILEEDQLVGLVTVRTRADHLFLDHLYILPDAQGLGLGDTILTDIHTRAQASNLPIRVIVLAGSRANAFYRTRGFALSHMEDVDLHYAWTPDSA